MTTENQAPEGELPLLPRPLLIAGGGQAWYSTDQMRAYARAALAAQPQAAPAGLSEAHRQELIMLRSRVRTQRDELAKLKKALPAPAEGDAEDLRIALAQRDIAIEGRDREAAKVKAMRAALDFAAGAIGDAIYTEDGLDGDTGQRVLHIITEARELGTFDQLRAEGYEVRALGVLP